MQKQRDKLEAEKEAILNNKNLIAEVLPTYINQSQHFYSTIYCNMAAALTNNKLLRISLCKKV